MTPLAPVGPSRGLNVVHLFCHPEGTVDAGAVRKAVDDAVALGVQVVTVAILGAKADTCFMLLGENLWDLRSFQSRIQGAGLRVAESYVSVTEICEPATPSP
jgi:peroxiredoxin